MMNLTHLLLPLPVENIYNIHIYIYIEREREREREIIYTDQ